jgi:hypothetical protein
VRRLALDVDLAALVEVLTNDFGGAVPSDQVVPFGAVLPLAVLVLVTLVGGQGELGDRGTLWRVRNSGPFPRFPSRKTVLTLFDMTKF